MQTMTYIILPMPLAYDKLAISCISSSVFGDKSEESLNGLEFVYRPPLQHPC